MADLQCVICNFTVEPESGDDELLALMGVNSPKSAEQLIRHMEGHELADWIKAFRMADVYIEQLEAKIKDLEGRPMQAPVQLVRQEPQWSAVAAQMPTDVFTPSPGELAEKQRRAQARSRVMQHDPNQTLIPRIPDAQRPEGVVGVKY